MCINETLFCDGIVDCGFTGIDEGPLFCGEFNVLAILGEHFIHPNHGSYSNFQQVL
jgi:hypothetical protein